MTKKQREQIAANRQNGLLCACNQQIVPCGREPEHGHNLVQGIVHGYHHCQPLEIFIREIVEGVLANHLKRDH